MTDDEIIGVILGFEGRFIDNPSDRGGPTNYGITASTLGRFRNLGRPATREEVQALTRQEAIGIYKANYIHAPHFDQVANDAVRLVITDSGVLHGPARAVAWVRRAVGLQDSARPMASLDQETITKVNTYNDLVLLPVRLLTMRLKSMTDIATRNRSQMQFLPGWTNRVISLLEEVA